MLGGLLINAKGQGNNKNAKEHGDDKNATEGLVIMYVYHVQARCSFH